MSDLAAQLAEAKREIIRIREIWDGALKVAERMARKDDAEITRLKARVAQLEAQLANRTP